jgi:hypothetical protein
MIWAHGRDRRAVSGAVVLGAASYRRGPSRGVWTQLRREGIFLLPDKKGDVILYFRPPLEPAGIDGRGTLEFMRPDG